MESFARGAPELNYEQESSGIRRSIGDSYCLTMAVYVETLFNRALGSSRPACFWLSASPVRAEFGRISL